jgi:hypothetical protein
MAGGAGAEREGKPQTRSGLTSQPKKYHRKTSMLKMPELTLWKLQRELKPHQKFYPSKILILKYVDNSKTISYSSLNCKNLELSLQTKG